MNRFKSFWLITERESSFTTYMYHLFGCTPFVFGSFSKLTSFLQVTSVNLLIKHTRDRLFRRSRDGTIRFFIYRHEHSNRLIDAIKLRRSLFTEAKGAESYIYVPPSYICTKVLVRIINVDRAAKK